MATERRSRPILTLARRKLAATGRDLERSLRRATSGLRLHPSFLVIGTQKGGTTSLYRYLMAHPDVRPPARKEVGFFGYRYRNGFDWYRAQFPLALPGGSPVTGEASTSYLFHPAVPARVARHLPEVRLVALLRDPVERAHSHYLHTKRSGREPLSFEDALEHEEERLAHIWPHLDDPGYAIPKGLGLYSYKARGRYWEQLERWYGAFDRSRLLVLRSEDMFDDPAGTYARVLAFLGLRPWQPERFKRHNPRVQAETIAPATRRALRRYFEPHNRVLYRELGHDLGWDDGRAPAAGVTSRNEA